MATVISPKTGAQLMNLGKRKASGAIRYALNAVCIHDRAFSKHIVKPTCVWKCNTLI